MTKRKLVMWWIDDEPKRLKSLALRRIEEGRHPALTGKRHAKLEPMFLRDTADRIELEGTLTKAEKGRKLPDLIIFDQNLNLAAANGIELRGSVLAVAVRAQAPTVPIVGVTAGDFSRIAELQRDQFIELFRLDDLQSGDRIPDLFAIADDYARIARERESSDSPIRRLRRILRWFDCPGDDADFLSSCLPGDFIAPWDDETAHAFARWVWHTLVGRAGFLIDDLELATMLGVKEKGLEKLTEHLRRCEYRGIFNSPVRRRWWVSRAREAIRSAAAAPTTEPLWKLGRQLLTEKYAVDFSKCYGPASKDCVPDVVAFQDDTRRQRVQARGDDTKLIETDTPPVGFEQCRVFCKK